MSRETSLVTAQWVEEHLDDPDRSCWSRSTRTPRPTTRATSRAPSSSTGRPTCRTRSVATSSTRQQFEALLSERGVGNDDTVVLYGGNNNWFAAYAYWYFKLYGHQDVKLLDGGRKKWELDSRELTDELPEPRADVVHRPGAGHLDPRVPRRDRRRDRHQEPGRRPQPRRVRRPAARPGPPPAGAGPARRATSRPPPTSRGARPPTTTAPSSSDDELKELYTEAGVDWSKDTIAYCRIGERSSHTWFVLKELLGQENVKNYDGSWTEYGSLVGVPVALGDEPGEA